MCDKKLSRQDIIFLIEDIYELMTRVNFLKYNKLLRFLNEDLKFNLSQSSEIASSYNKKVYLNENLENIIDYLKYLLVDVNQDKIFIKKTYYNKIIDTIEKVKNDDLKIR